MNRTGYRVLWWIVWIVIGGFILIDAVPALAQGSNAEALRARYTTLRNQLADNPFQRPLALDSKQASGDLKGDIHAIVEHPFATVATSVKSANQWCEILILHINVKHCAVASQGQGQTLSAYIGRKNSASANGAHRVAFQYRVAAETPDYLQIRLDADKGPFGTSNYRIVLEAVPLDDRRTFLHLSYSYAYGAAAAFAMRAYFNTTGMDKVGFTVVERTADGQVVHVGDIRGALERNTMRYFLAIDTYLGARSESQIESRLRNWFAATERYARQLRELDEAEYLELKRNEYRRVLAAR